MKIFAFAPPLEFGMALFGENWPEVPNYEAMKIPANNAMTAAKVELGE